LMDGSGRVGDNPVFLAADGRKPGLGPEFVDRLEGLAPLGEKGELLGLGAQGGGDDYADAPALAKGYQAAATLPHCRVEVINPSAGHQAPFPCPLRSRPSIWGRF
jgi:hypothetical protein